MKRHQSLGFSLRVALLALATLALSGLTALAKVSVATIFTDNMVLQRGKAVPVWGWAADSEQVTVTFRGQRVSTKAKDGRWSVELKNLKAGGPDVLTIDGRNRIELINVMVGEVWVASGQSNMEWSLSKLGIEPTAIESSPFVRLFHVDRKTSDTPLKDLDMPWNVGVYGWQVADSQSAPDFSAVAYYFAKKLQEDLGVPVGVIASSWGGTPIEAWMSDETIRRHTAVMDAYYLGLAEFEAEKRKRAPWKPSVLYNGMIKPLIPYAIQGFIWYQGESNAGMAWHYRELLPDMIKQWRNDWGSSDLTFLTVQLAPWDRNQKRSLEEITQEPTDSTWAELREAQWLAAEKDPRTGLVVITDLGEKDDIHPKHKAPVGERLALAARGIAYRERLTYSGPTYKSMKYEKNKFGADKIVLRFDHIGSGLKKEGEKLTGFAICGAARNWVWANAEIVGETVEVSHPEVPEPVAVRYGWADFPVVNLYNYEGLPASPFRTDKFKLTTEP